MPSINISLQKIISGKRHQITRWQATVDDNMSITAKEITKEAAIGKLMLMYQSYFGVSFIERQIRVVSKQPRVVSKGVTSNA